MPDVFDRRDRHDQFDIHLGSLLGFSRNASLTTLNKADAASYLYHSVFGFSTNGALYSTVIAEASHDIDLDEVVQTYGMRPLL